MLYLIILILVFLTLRLLLSVNLVFTIINLILIVTYFQFVLSPYLILNEYVDATSYSMSINQGDYFILISIYFIALIIGLNSNNSYFRNNVSKAILYGDLKNTIKGYSLIITTVFFNILSFFDFLSSFNSFTQYLLFVGGFYLIFGRFNLFDKIIVFAIFFKLLLNAIGQSIFIEFFVWILFLYFVFSLRYEFSLKIKAIYMIGLVFLVISIQGLKDEYRTILWDDRNIVSSTDIFADLAAEQFIKKSETKGFSKSEEFNKTIIRLNQGWHFEQAMKQVPSEVDFSYGAEVVDDILNSILPRVLMPSKKAVTNRDKFIYYTGYNLSEDTAMTIGVFGDAYINFGFYGFVFIFVIAKTFLWFFKFFIKNYISINGTYIFWLPFFSHYFIRAGNDFYIVLNSFFKGFLIFLIVNYFWKKNKI